MDMTNTTLYSVSEAAQILGVHPNTLRKWDNEGIANALRLPGGNHRRFTQAEIERLAVLMRPETTEAE